MREGVKGGGGGGGQACFKGGGAAVELPVRTNVAVARHKLDGHTVANDSPCGAVQHIDKPVLVVHVGEEEQRVIRPRRIECVNKPRLLDGVFDRCDGDDIRMVLHVVEKAKSEQAHASRTTNEQLRACADGSSRRRVEHVGCEEGTLPAVHKATGACEELDVLMLVQLTVPWQGRAPQTSRSGQVYQPRVRAPSAHWLPVVSAAKGIVLIRGRSAAGGTLENPVPSLRSPFCTKNRSRPALAAVAESRS